MKKYYGSYAPVRYNKTHKHPNIGLGQKHQTNSYYLNRAYHNSSGTYIKDDTIYLAGSRNMKDVAQWPLIPLGLTHKSDIYRRADQILKDNPHVKSIVAHSYGGSAALELQKKYRDRNYKTTTFSAPVLSIQKGEKFSKPYDPVSLFDLGKSTIPQGDNYNLHGYE